MIVKVTQVREKARQFSGFVGLNYKGCKDSKTVCWDKYGNLNTGLTKEDEERLGKALKQDLSKESTFWHDYRVILSDKDLILNLDEPKDELKYKVLLAHPEVASSINDNNPKARYVVHNETEEAKNTVASASVKINASVLYSKLTIDQKKDVLRLYPGTGITGSVSNEIIEARLYEFMENDPAKFVRLVEDKKRDMKVFLKDLITAKILRKNKNAYYYGDDVLGHDEESTITHLDDPANQSLKIALMQELKISKK